MNIQSVKIYPLYPVHQPVMNAQGANTADSPKQNIDFLVSQIGQRTYLPDVQRNYSVLNQELVGKIVARKEEALPSLMRFLKVVQDERQVTEGLYILDRMIDAGAKDIYKTYPVISRFNHTDSPNVQVMLAGIYRKTQVPDGFGPLMSMLVKNSINPPRTSFDPNEEIGGAILEYLRNKSAQKVYS